jgi:hypothetical protein
MDRSPGGGSVKAVIEEEGNDFVQAYFIAHR